MSQPSVSAYYSLRKRAANQPTAKTVLDEVTPTSTRKLNRGAKIESAKLNIASKVVVKNKTVAKTAESLTLKSETTPVKVSKFIEYP